MPRIKYTREQLWALYRNENTKVRRMRERQAKLRELVRIAWSLLKDTKGRDTKKSK